MLVFWWARRRHGSQQTTSTARVHKYVVACAVCGCLCVAHGIIFVVLYLLLRSYTSSLHFFETVPAYLPGGLFIINGAILAGFVKRKNRYAVLVKGAGVCCGACVLLCVTCTVTTAVVHMHRLQSLRECVYTAIARTCACAGAGAEGRFVFVGVISCDVVHGSLYACLRALFCCAALGVLLCVACAALLYQLATHERKRLYCRQLELRRRFQRHPSSFCCYDDPFFPPLWTPAQRPWWQPWRNHEEGRRTRSNDGVFLHMAPYSVADAYAHIPRYLWGPPPPYSQPQSQNIVPLDSPKDTPQRTRRFVCHEGGITLHIEGPEQGKKEATCVVEVHQPCPLSRHPLRHTLPARHPRRKTSFKSLTTLPPAGLLTLSTQLDRPLPQPGEAQSMPDLQSWSPQEEDSCMVYSSEEESSSSCGGLIVVGASSVLVGRPSDCPIDCAIRHLHRYRKIEVREGGRTEHAFDLNNPNFVVTIKSFNV